MKKWIGVLAIIFLCTACSQIKSKHFRTRTTNQGVAAPTQPTAPTRYFIFLVHGIGGDETTFAYMTEALENHLNRLDPSKIYDVKALKYDTGDDNKTTYDFARQTSEEIKNYLDANGGLQETDKISFVVHSQGGLVVSQLLFFTCAKDPDFYQIPFRQFEALVTLGTPFWGSKSAGWGSSLRNLGRSMEDSFWFGGMLTRYVGRKIEQALDGFGDTELKDMFFDSDKVHEFFNSAVLINENPTNPMSQISKSVRVLNIAGYIPESEYHNGMLHKPLHAWTIGLDNIETDNSVIVPAARSDFLYVKSSGDYETSNEINGTRFKETNMSQFVVVPALHVNPSFPNPWTMAGVKLFRSLKGIAQIDQDCIENLECSHPSFKLIVEHILGHKIETLNKDLPNMSAFILSFNVTVPAGYDLPVKAFDFDWYMKEPEIKVNSAWEFGAHGGSALGKSQTRRFYFTGGVRGSFNANNPKYFTKKYINVRISAPGLKTRQIEIPVRASYTTIIDVNMEPDGRLTAY